MVKNVNAIDTSDFVKKIDYDAKINEIKVKLSNIAGLATTTKFNDVKNKIPNVSILAKKKQFMMEKFQT